MAAAIHPLDPASRDELATAISIYAGSPHFKPNSVYSSATLLEPDKQVVASHIEGKAVARIVHIVGFDDGGDGGFEVDIDVGNAAVLRCARLPVDAQAPYGHGDVETAINLTKANAEWLAAVKARGVHNIELVQIDPWPGSGRRHPSIAAGHRAMRCISFVREDKTDNGYAHPIHGLIAHVDLTLGKVVHVENEHPDLKAPTASGRYDATSQSHLRKDLKAVSITQPDGPSFVVEGYLVKWQGWQFRVSMHPIHGLVLHQLSINTRPVLYRASLSEMVVPYGDSDSMHNWKHVMDASEYSMGTLVNSLKLGCDCIGEIYYFDIDQVNWKGEVRTVEHAICMHEEDYGIAWKHYDGHSETSEVRRSRRLVISSIHTIGNYDYGFFWYLYLDGTIQMEIKLTGIVGVSTVTPDTHNPAQAPIIAENLASPVHQHLFCFRLDWALDGGHNSLYESEIEPMTRDVNNPDGTQFRNVARHLTRESEAKRDIAPEKSRVWMVTNPAKVNAWQVPVAYKLLPGASPTLFAHPDSIVAKRAAFARHNLWATPHDGEQTHAAGAHTVMHEGQVGLAQYTKGDRDISLCDLVMWHTFGVTHVPRPEDWPVMPVEYCGFHLIPSGFFDRNPTLGPSVIPSLANPRR